MMAQMPTKDTKHIKLDPEAHRVAKVAAAAAGMTLERWIAEAIEDHAEQQEDIRKAHRPPAARPLPPILKGMATGGSGYEAER